jgi:hypothetical protein
MAAEQFANAAQSTLSSAINSAASSLLVDNATAFPTQGNFRILIDAELLLVTAVSGNTFTVSRAVEAVAGVQFAAAHAAGATVTHVLTAASVQLACPSDMLATLVNNPNSLSNPGGSTLLANTWNVITATAACNAKLPSPAAGKVIGVRITPGSTNLFTLNPNAAETIDGAPSRILWAGESAILISDGTNWFKVAGKSIPMSCQMRLNANQTGLVTTQVNKINVNTTDFDNTGLMADPGTNHRITIKRPGLYITAGTVIFNMLSAIGTRCLTIVNKNGNGDHQNEAYGAVGGFPSTITVSHAPENLSGGDYFELAEFHNTGANEAVFGQASGSSSFLGVTEVPSW